MRRHRAILTALAGLVGASHRARPEALLPRTRPAGPCSVGRPGGPLRRITGSVTAGSVMLAGLPLALDYIVRPGDTLSEIAQDHDTTVRRIVARNDLHRSGDVVYVGQRLRLPGSGEKRARAHHRHRRHRSDKARRVHHNRRIVHYTVRPGDTPSGLAVRFHAWTDEVIARNGPVLRVGERIAIPVVVSAARKARKARKARHHARSDRRHAQPSKHARAKHSRSRHSRSRPSPSRHRVRRVVAATARRHGVDPDLALAVAWQESGWQMHHVSSAGAIGAMQVLPSTGRWMSLAAGRRLKLRDLRDNATAGVLLLDTLLAIAPRRRAVAGYYQGLAGVRRHGMYDDTKRYVANVMTLHRRFRHGRYPA